MFTVHLANPFLSVTWFMDDHRIVPPLPPQKLSALVRAVDSEFAEARRKGLLRWLRLLSAHPIISNDPAIEVCTKVDFS